MGSGSSAARGPSYPTSRAKMASQTARSGSTVFLSARLRDDAAGGAALDLFIDSAAGKPEPLPAGTAITGVVQISGSGVSKPVTFAPAAGAGERAPGEAADGPCSHFIAPASFVTRDSIVVVTVSVGGEELCFKNFIVALFAWRDE